MSVHEKTWDRELKMHTCCGSRHLYHKPKCPMRRSFLGPGRESDPLFIKIQELKTQDPDMTSLQMARILQIPLEQVNDLFAL